MPIHWIQSNGEEWDKNERGGGLWFVVLSRQGTGTDTLEIKSSGGWLVFLLRRMLLLYVRIT